MWYHIYIYIYHIYICDIYIYIGHIYIYIYIYLYIYVVCPTDLARPGAFPPEVRHEFRLRLLVLLDVQLLERFHDRAMAARDAVVHCRGGDRVEVRPELRDDLLVRLALHRRDAALVPDHSGDMHLTRSPRVHGTSGGDVGCRRRVKVNAPGIHTHTHTRV